MQKHRRHEGGQHGDVKLDVGGARVVASITNAAVRALKLTKKTRRRRGRQGVRRYGAVADALAPGVPSLPLKATRPRTGRLGGCEDLRRAGASPEYQVLVMLYQI